MQGFVALLPFLPAGALLPTATVAHRLTPTLTQRGGWRGAHFVTPDGTLSGRALSDPLSPEERARLVGFWRGVALATPEASGSGTAASWGAGSIIETAAAQAERVGTPGQRKRRPTPARIPELLDNRHPPLEEFGQRGPLVQHQLPDFSKPHKISAESILLCDDDDLLWAFESTKGTCAVRYSGPSAHRYHLAACEAYGYSGTPEIVARSVTMTITKAIIGAALLAAISSNEFEEPCTFISDNGPYISQWCTQTNTSLDIIISGAGRDPDGRYSGLWAPARLTITGAVDNDQIWYDQPCGCGEAVWAFFAAACVLLHKVQKSTVRSHLVIVAGAAGLPLHEALRRLSVEFSEQTEILHGLGRCFKMRINARESNVVGEDSLTTVGRMALLFNAGFSVARELVWTSVEDEELDDTGALKHTFDIMEIMFHHVMSGQVKSLEEAC